jgi:ElaB/YqjD/DUF883 family membrane-anchored ribosome-binding protein
MSASFVSKVSEFIRNAITKLTQFVSRSPWVAAAAAAALVMLFLA